MLTRPSCDGREPAPSRKIAIERQAAACDGPLFTFGRSLLPRSRPPSAGEAYLALAMG